MKIVHSTTLIMPPFEEVGYIALHMSVSPSTKFGVSRSKVKVTVTVKLREGIDVSQTFFVHSYKYSYSFYTTFIHAKNIIS